jgi:serine/threonine protein kinase
LEAQDLISKLLHKDPTHRITMDAARSHPWFEHIRKRAQPRSNSMDSTAPPTAATIAALSAAFAHHKESIPNPQQQNVMDLKIASSTGGALGGADSAQSSPTTSQADLVADISRQKAAAMAASGDGKADDFALSANGVVHADSAPATEPSSAP